MAPIWVKGDLPGTTAYLFYQGIANSQSVASRYIGNRQMGASTGEIARSSKKGIFAFPPQHLWVYPELDEIDRDHPWAILSRLLQWQRGIQVTDKKRSSLDYTTPYPQNETGSVHAYKLNKRTSLGQNTDIASHKNRYDALTNPDIKNGAGDARELPSNIVLYGASRGAATTFSALATHQADYKNVRLCVLEAPPATISAVLKGWFPRWLAKFLYQDVIVQPFLGEAHKTDKKQQAMGYVDQFPDNIPLIIISAKDDAVVPHKSSLNLALRIASKRMEAKNKSMNDATQPMPVYFLQLDKGGHNAAIGCAESRERYQNFLHAVYKKHGLPYVDDFAKKGEHELNVAELTNGQLKQQVAYQQAFKQVKTRAVRDMIRTAALDDLNSQLPADSKKSQDAMDDARRMINICEAMPLYSKYKQGFFWKTNLKFTKAQLESRQSGESNAHFIPVK